MFTTIILKCVLPFPEMVEAMKKVAVSGIELSVEERNLLSVAFKNVIGARRASWRIMTSIEQKSESKDDSSKQNQVKNYRTQVCESCQTSKDQIPQSKVPTILFH